MAPGPAAGLVRGLRLLGSFALLFAASSVAVAFLHGRGLLGGGDLLFGGGRRVVVVPLEGEIRRSDDFVEALRDLESEEDVAAVVLRVNSPGGAVAPSQEMYDAVRRLAGVKPVVASLGEVAASGGYYVAAASDSIVANPGTLTGSIGVILSVTNVSELLRKLGIEADVIKAGARKDMGSPLRPLTAEDRATFQRMLDQVHDQFIDAVASGRRMPLERMRKLADGRVFTGQQALDSGLVDQMGGLQDAIRLAASRGGVTGEPRVERRNPSRRPWWLRAVATEDVAAPLDGGLGLLARVLQDAAAGGGPRDGLLWRMPLVSDGIRW